MSDNLIVLVYSVGCISIGCIAHRFLNSRNIKDAYKEGHRIGMKEGYKRAVEKVKAYQSGQQDLINMLQRKGANNGEKNEL